jgi:hypothetical protein
MEIPCEKALLGEVVVLRSMQSACEGANERTFCMEGAAISNQMARVDNKKPADPVATQEYAVLGSESAAKAPCLDPMDSLRCDQLSLQNFTTETIGTNEASDRPTCMARAQNIRMQIQAMSARTAQIFQGTKAVQAQ